jgi:hypothetical protein
MPAPFTPVGARDFFDETVLRKRAQVIAAGRGALSDLFGAFGRGRVAAQLQPREYAQARGVAERP